MTQAPNSFPESPDPAPQTALQQTAPALSPPSSTLHTMAPEASASQAANSPFPAPSNADGLTETPEVLKRPEAVIFLLFISLFVFWDAYVDFLEADFSPGSTAISASQLARRLKVSRKTIRRRKREPDFPSWTQSLDPDQTTWIYRKGYYLSQS